MRLINWLTTAFEQWRQRTDDMQYASGYEWVHQEFYNNGLGLMHIMRDFSPVQTAFDRGVMQAAIDLERKQATLREDAEIEFNAIGDPVGVPFFIHPDNMDHTRVGQEAVEVYTVDPHAEMVSRTRRQCLHYAPKVHFDD